VAADKEVLIRGIFEAYNRGDLERSFSLVRPDFVMDWSNSLGPIKGIYQGRDELTEVWRTFTSAWSEVRWSAEEAIEVDDWQAVVVNHISMRGGGSGAAVDATGAQLWRFEDGVPSSVKLFQSKREALAAAESA
jgi:ketosteroid isomerase-like protein